MHSIRCLLLAAAILSIPAIMTQAQEREFAPLPVKITSFGGAVDGDWVYAFGGNAGGAHNYCREDQNTKLFRINLQNGGEWEEVSVGPPMQGLGMVAHQGHIYRMGGMQAVNSRDEDQKLLSTDEVARFDVEAGEWETLPKLPEGRSSFDAVVSGDVIYIVGGWTLEDDAEIWLKTAYKMDLSKDELSWEKLPDPPFQRRALALASHQGKVIVVGGMDELGPTNETAIFDPETEDWTKGPKLPGEPMVGFGAAAFELRGYAFVSNLSGKLLQLNEDMSAWEVLKTEYKGRMFHQMMPISDQEMLIYGGTAMRAGKQPTAIVVKVNE